MEVDILTIPVGRQVEGAAVGAGVVVGLRDVGRVVLERSAPRIARILVDLVAVALNLEETGNWEVYPL